MVDRKNEDGKFIRPLAYVAMAVIIMISFSFFLLWRIDNPRAELIRISVIDKIVPNLDWAMTPMTKASQMVQNFQSYKRLYDQNQELRNELQKMRSWREAALQLEQENARLLDLNNVKIIKSDIKEMNINDQISSVLIKNFSNKIVSKLNFDEKIEYLINTIRSRLNKNIPIFMLTGSTALEADNFSDETKKKLRSSFSTLKIETPYFDTNRYLLEIKHV